MNSVLMPSHTTHHKIRVISIIILSKMLTDYTIVSYYEIWIRFASELLLYKNINIIIIEILIKRNNAITYIII